jgi:hypothetical protein
MNKTEKIADKIFKFLCSLKLAVLVIVTLGTIAAVGTIVESKYDMITAQKLVYHSPYMYGVLIFLCINLIAVAVDRLPWKKRHIGFVTVHAGIVTLIVGAYITHKIGVDGTLAMDIGESARSVSTNATDLIVYKLKDMENSEKIFSQDVDFMVDSPKKNPVKISVKGNKDQSDELEIVDYMPYAKKDFQIIESDKVTDGPSLRFQLQNQFVNVIDWVVQTGSQPAKLDLGPATVVLARDKYETLGGKNEVVLLPSDKHTLKYQIFNKEGKVTRSGLVPVGGVVETGWMGLTLRVIQYYPKGRVEYSYTKLEYPNPQSTAAAQVKFNGEKYWLGMNTALQLFSKDTVYFVTYGNKHLDLGFNMTLDRFEMEKYEGTDRAKSYKSIVDVTGVGQKEISMNEPLKHNGYTFYQSSFQENRMGEPTGSVLSVNYDPGRWIKYLGSLGIVLGTIMLFYFRKFGVKVPDKSKFMSINEEVKR